MKRVRLIFGVLILTLLSGCYVENTPGGAISFDGSIEVSNGTFSMNGDLAFTGGVPPQATYENISLELYDENGELIRRQKLGTIHGEGDSLPISVTLPQRPHFIILDSPDIWDGETEITFYTWYSGGDGSYYPRGATRRSELPITPTGNGSSTGQ